MEKLMIDSDVIINWLAQEEEKNSHRSLWVAPSVIFELGERGQTENHLSIITLFEVRFVLRRKKKLDHNQIEQDLTLLRQIIRCNIPGNSEMKQANQLQSEHELDPFDSIILSQALSLEATIISRDRRFLEIAHNYGSAFSPEAYLEYCQKS